MDIFQSNIFEMGVLLKRYRETSQSFSDTLGMIGLNPRVCSQGNRDVHEDREHYVKNSKL